MSNDIEAALAAGKALADYRPIDLGSGRFVMVIPQEMKMECLERFRESPYGIRDFVVLGDAASFISYVKKFAGENTVIFFDQSKTQFNACIDYHSRSKASWNRHTAAYGCPLDKEFAAWVGQAEKWHGQISYAEWLDDRRRSIAEPAGAKVVEIISALQGSEITEIVSKQNIQNGAVHLQYKTSVSMKSGAGGAGELEIPSVICLSIPVFYRREKHELKVELRWKFRDGKLSFLHKIPLLQELKELAVESLVKDITDGTGIQVLRWSDGTRDPMSEDE